MFISKELESEFRGRIWCVMGLFRYRAQDADGVLQEGELQAESAREAAQVLRGQMLRVLQVREVREKGRKWKRWKHLSLQRRHAVLFCRQLAVMIDTQPLHQVLSAIGSQGGEKAYLEMVQKVHAEVELGHGLSEALRSYDDIFPRSAVQLIAAGEASGTLPEVLNRLAGHLEKDYAARQRFQAILVYPVILAVSALVVGVLMIFFILPSFAAFFEGLSMELPLPTRILLFLGRVLAEDGAWVAGGGLLLLVLFAWLYSVEGVRYAVDRWLLRIPVFGQLKQETAWMYLLGTQAVLLESGIRMDMALELGKEVTENRYLQRFMEKTRKEVLGGSTLAAVLSGCPVFPAMLLQLVDAGERAGRLEEMLQKAADYCRLSAEIHTQKMQALLEPALILVMGGIVIFFVLAVAVPMLDSMEAVGM